MAKEIERKFLVKPEFKDFAVKQINIVQGYLSIDRERIIRIRISDDSAYLSVKCPVRNTAFSRNEWEINVPLSTAEEIMDVCLPGKIIKTRYIVPYAGHNFEVDEFHDKNEGLVVAEIELSDENEPFGKPGWLGEEVTGRPEYYNSNLI